jgi:hypothetical protein
MIEMTNKEYSQTQRDLLRIAAAMIKLNLSEFIRRGETGLSVGPIADPSLFRDAAPALAAILTIARAMLEIEQKLARTFTKMGWRPQAIQDYVECQLWVAGRILSTERGKVSWEIQGVFTEQAAAEAACKNPFYFIGPIRLNEELPAPTWKWPGAYFPKTGE